MDSRTYAMDSLSYYFVVKQVLSDGNAEFSLSSYARIGDDLTTLPFDTETDAALYLLDEYRKGARIAHNDIEIAQAILHGEKPMFLYEVKQSDGTLLLSLHDTLPPEDAKVVSFASRSSKVLARFLLRRLHESQLVKADAETIARAQAMMG